MKKGSDIKNGATVLKKGQVLTSSEIGVLAALGLTSAKVLRIPMVAVLSTGGEVTDPGKPLPEGKIYDINAYSVSTAVIESGGKPVYFGSVPDDKDAWLRRCRLPWLQQTWLSPAAASLLAQKITQLKS